MHLESNLEQCAPPLFFRFRGQTSEDGITRRPQRGAALWFSISLANTRSEDIATKRFPFLSIASKQTRDDASSFSVSLCSTFNPVAAPKTPPVNAPTTAFPRPRNCLPS